MAWSLSSMPSMRVRNTCTILPLTRFGGSTSLVTPLLHATRSGQLDGWGWLEV